jgi:hypothetical protein
MQPCLSLSASSSSPTSECAREPASAGSASDVGTHQSLEFQVEEANRIIASLRYELADLQTSLRSTQDTLGQTVGALAREQARSAELSKELAVRYGPRGDSTRGLDSVCLISSGRSLSFATSVCDAVASESGLVVPRMPTVGVLPVVGPTAPSAPLSGAPPAPPPPPPPPPPLPGSPARAPSRMSLRFGVLLRL